QPEQNDAGEDAVSAGPLLGRNAEQAEERQDEQAEEYRERDAVVGLLEPVDQEALLDRQLAVPDDDELGEEQVRPEHAEGEGQLAEVVPLRPAVVGLVAERAGVADREQAGGGDAAEERGHEEIRPDQ